MSEVLDSIIITRKKRKEKARKRKRERKEGKEGKRKDKPQLFYFMCFSIS